MLLGVEYTKKASDLATPHVVLTDNCEDRRYLSERLTYHTAGTATTKISGSVGELSERLTCNTLGIHNQRHCR